MRPHIARDYCSGCSACVQACTHGCLAMEWSFATLVRPASCTGEGACVRACPEGLIEMRMDAAVVPLPDGGPLVRSRKRG